MAIDRVRALKQERPGTGGTETDEYPAPAEPNEDAPELRGLYLQNDTSNDTTTLITRDNNSHLTLQDGKVPLTRKLVDQLLEGLNIESVGTTEDETYTTGQLTESLLKVGSTPLRRITYTYSGGILQTEVVQVYASNGTTVIGQVSKTYTYSSGQVSQITTVRDV